MKWFKTACAAAAVCLGSAAHAAGPYDGIWAANVSGVTAGYFSLHQNGSQLVVAWLPIAGQTTNSWEAYIGVLSGTTATVNSIVGGVNASFRVTFDNTVSATITQLSCAPRTSRDFCSYPNGTVIPANRIF